MEKASRRKKRKRPRLIPAAEATSVIHDLSDDLLELVLLGLDSPVSLIRAAATCKQWRRVVSSGDGSFLSRFRSLQPPRAIGTYYNVIEEPFSYARFHWPAVDPVFVPSSATDGPGGGLQLSLDFVPCAGELGELVDGRDSLLLLFKEKDGMSKPLTLACDCLDDHEHYIFPDLVVCEPVTRRYQAIPPPSYGVFILGAFLLDADADQAIGMTNFRVLLVLYEHDYDEDCHNGHGYPSASVFNTCGSNGGWHHGEQNYDGVYLPRLDEIHFAGRTGGRNYWSCDDKHVVVMDEHTLEFYNMALSDHMITWWSGWENVRNNLRIVSGGDGAVRIVHLSHAGDLEVFSQPHGRNDTDDWVFQMKIQMVEASRGLPGWKEKYFSEGSKIIDIEEGKVMVSPEKTTWLYSLHLETMKLKREFERKKYIGPAYPHTLPWPPVMRACVENDGMKGRKRRRKRRKRPSSNKS